MLRIERVSNGSVVLTISGAIEAGEAKELERLVVLEGSGKGLVLDLKDVTLVDRDAVSFLGRSAEAGAKLANCPAYIREWIAREMEERDR